MEKAGNPCLFLYLYMKKIFLVCILAGLPVVLFSCKKKTECIECNGELVGCENSYNPAQWQNVTWDAWKATQLINPDCRETEKK